MRRHLFTKWNLALAAVLAVSGCAAGGGTTALREPGFRPNSVRRPALMTDSVGLVLGPFSSR